MTKKEYAKQIVATVKNGIDEGCSTDEIIEVIEQFLDPVEPVDKNIFAKWGYPSCQVEPDKCWD